MADELCVICGETEDGNAGHDMIPTHVHPFTPPSALQFVAIDKTTGQREEITDLYWFEENHVHSFIDHYRYTFEVTIAPTSPINPEIA